MKKIIKKVLSRLFFSLLFCIGLLILFVFNPSFLYAKETKYKNFTIYHNREIGDDLKIMIDTCFSSLDKSEFFNKELHINICLNDGSKYPWLIEKLFGPDVMRSFANNTVIQADVFDYINNKLVFTGWSDGTFKASQWLAHSFTHCLQYRRLGFFGSNPIARYDEWKWEGYSEYTSYGTGYSIENLVEEYLRSSDKHWVQMEDGSKTLRSHLQYLIMMRYCIDVKKLTYVEVLNINKSPELVFEELMNWYQISRID